MKYDVIVIGGSAIGGVAASSCGKAGLKTAIVEEDKKIGKYKRCTAICSERGLAKTGVKYRNAILNKVIGGIIHSPKNEVEIKMKNDIGIVFDRQIFDENSINSAIENNAVLFNNRRVISIQRFGITNYSICSAGITFHSKMVVGADGVASKTASEFNFPPLPKVAYCFEKEIKNVKVPHKDLVDIFIDNKNLPGFFGWCVPVDEKTVRVGFGVTKLEGFLNSKKYLFSHPSLSFLNSKYARTVRLFNAAVPLGPRKITQIKEVILVGDAAGQTKATTGGGLVFGSQCAKLIGECAVEFLIENKRLDYEEKWRRRFGNSLNLHKAVRNCADLLPNQILDLSLSVLKLPFINSFLSHAASMDYILKI
ncbi:MAG: NAD(P)/FAD-dependent oxidoreductase [Candidatus Micrarchaeota archaeon]|nr:NAD(P)/FAD-dependent oxidoreductase [Candidatus Micrarchaeota archaeon]